MPLGQRERLSDRRGVRRKRRLRRTRDKSDHCWLYRTWIVDLVRLGGIQNCARHSPEAKVGQFLFVGEIQDAQDCAKCRTEIGARSPVARNVTSAESSSGGTGSISFAKYG
jgi:hypothetical protein